MKVFIAILCFMGFCSKLSLAGEGNQRMTGSELIACSKALKEFTNKNPGIDLSHYEVLIKDNPGSFEVVFVPNQVPYDPSASTREVTVGGRTPYGPEVHYVISHGTYEITRTFYGR
jgi:hypothetical protein